MQIIDEIKKYRKFIYFGIVGGFGTILNTAILFALTSYAGINYLIASMIATETAIISNFIGNNYITFKDKNKETSIFKKFLSFQMISLIALFGTMFFLWLFVTLFGKNLLLVWNIIAIVIMFVVNYILNVSFTWKSKATNTNKDKYDKRLEKKHSISKSILIIFFVLFLIYSSFDVNAKVLNNIVDKNVADNITINLTAPIINTTNQTILSTDNSIVNLNQLTLLASPNTNNQTINVTTNSTANQTTNNTVNMTNSTINPPINITANITTNQTINQTLNITNNITINPPINITTNQTINVTNNQTNLTTNITTNVTTNITTNFTTNITTNITTNQTINQTLNITNNITINPPINITTNITTNQTSNITNNNSNNQTNNTANAVSYIINTGTNLKIISTVNGTNTYYMREDRNATFFVLYNVSSTTDWYVDGVEQNLATSQNATFFWNPGILYLPRAPDYGKLTLSTITAVTPYGTINWTVQVEDVINPFFSSVDDSADVVGSPDTKIRIFTNDNIVNFTSVNVTILSSAGNQIYQLSKQSDILNETYWSIYLVDTTPGNNYLTTIIGYNNITGTVLTYDIGTSRAHYKSFPVVNSGGSGSSGSSSGGGGSGGSSGGSSYGSGISLIPEVVYVMLDKDVVGSNQTQTITLDAKGFIGGINGVTVKLLNPDKTTQDLQLELVAGTKDYGTWSTSFGNFTILGQYNVSLVTLKSDTHSLTAEVNVENRSFYYTSKTGSANVDLNLVYSALDKSVVDNGTVVTLTLDATDSKGISSVNAYINKIIGNNTTSLNTLVIPLTLTRGTKDYGTWVGTFVTTTPDSTYSVVNITLNNTKDIKTYQIIDRQVYVTPIPTSNSLSLSQSQNSLSGITGSAILSSLSKENLSTFIKSPFAPTLIGFFLMTVIGSLIIFSKKS